MENLAMFCYQCEQTAKGEACVKAGVCGKDAEVSALQDLLVYALEGLSVVAVDARKAGITDREVDVFTVKALFSTLTNVDFDPARFVELIGKAVAFRDALKNRAIKAGAAVDEKPACVTYRPEKTVEGLIAQADAASLKPAAGANADIESLKHIVLFGLKGVAAYADHAQILRFMLLFMKRWRRSPGKIWICKAGSAWYSSAARSTCGRWSFWTRPTQAPSAIPYRQRSHWAPKRVRRYLCPAMT